MKKLTFFNIKPSVDTNALRPLLVNKVTAALTVAMVLLLFGDTLLPLFGHILHILIEAIESAAEHLLGYLFDLSKRQAEMIVFYSGLGLALKLLWIYSRKAYFIHCAYIPAFGRAKAPAYVWLRVQLGFGLYLCWVHWAQRFSSSLKIVITFIDVHVW